MEKLSSLIGLLIPYLAILYFAGNSLLAIFYICYQVTLTTMKKIIVIFLCWLALVSCSNSATIIHVRTTDTPIIVALPVKGANFWANKKVLTSGTLEIPKEDNGIFMIRGDFGNARIITFPGDNITLNITPSGITFKGSNAAGHQFFNSLDRPLILDVNNPYEKDTVASIIEQKITAKKNKELGSLDSLLKAGSITKAYHDFATLDIQYYYAASLADAMCSKYFKAKRAKQDVLFREKFSTLWERSFKVMPLNSPAAISTENFKYYAEIYYTWYTGAFLNGKKLTHLSNYASIHEHFDGKVAEYLKAQYIYFNVRQQRYEPSLVDIFQQFARQYPKSNYIPFIKSDIDSIIAYQRAIEKENSTENKFLPHFERINSLAELLDSLKGEAYYVDIWGTYCVPCKEEFKYKSALQQLLTSKNIQTLYLSLDKDEQDESWKNMINYFELSGLHVRANARLRKDLYQQLGEKNVLFIPRYLLVDKNGTIVHRHAERPGDTAKLRLQINNYLTYCFDN